MQHQIEVKVGILLRLLTYLLNQIWPSCSEFADVRICMIRARTVGPRTARHLWRNRQWDWRGFSVYGDA